jgi:starch synthase
MRIFYICYEDLSGQAAWTTHIREVIGNLQGLGSEVILFAPKIGKVKSDFGVQSIYVPTINVRLLNECLYYFLLFFCIAAFQIRLRADILYVREMSVCLPVALISKFFKVPHIIEVNGAVIEERKIAGISEIKARLYQIFQRINFSLCNKIIVVAEYLRTYLKEHYNIVDKKIATVKNGANLDLFRPLDKKTARLASDLSVDGYYVTYVGSFYPHHNLADFVTLLPGLLQQLDNLSFILVGEGPLRGEIEKFVIKLGLTNHVHFVGEVRYSEVPKFINASDLCVMFYIPSPRISGYPLKLLEYLSCGVPVVVNWKAFGGKPFANKRIGIEIDLSDREDAADRIVGLLTDEALRKSMGRKARRFIEDNFSWRMTATKILTVCQDLRD